jgi:dihydrofolate reductase
VRKLIYAINVTLDGCVDHTKQSVANESPEFLEYFVQLLRNSDAEVFGRKTYELMVPYWPDVAKHPESPEDDLEFARAFADVKKIVFSRSLDPLEDGNTRITRNDLRDEMIRLKQQEGNDILVGGVDIPSQLVELGLIDEFIFVVAPTIVGEGRRLFDGVDLPESLQLELIGSKFFGSGRVALHYAKQ